MKSFILSALVTAAAAVPNNVAQRDTFATSDVTGALKVTSQSGSLQVFEPPVPASALNQTVASTGNVKLVKSKLRNIAFGSFWGVNVKARSQNFLLAIDTAGGDTWFYDKDFQCVAGLYEPIEVDQSACAPGSSFSNGFGSGKDIPNQALSIHYGATGLGEIAGPVGTMNLKVAGFNINQQLVSLVNETSFNGNGYLSGFLGLGFQALTNVYNSRGKQVLYPPVIETMKSNGLSPNLFSVALQRSASNSTNTPGGKIAFGGLPPVNFDTTFASTPLLIDSINGINSDNYSYYTIQPDAYSYPANTKTKKLTPYPASSKAIISTSDRVTFVPSEIFNGWVDSFQFPAASLSGAYLYPCSGTPISPFAVTINGTTFNFDAADLILQPAIDLSVYGPGLPTNYCLLGIQDQSAFGIDFSILGGSFLKNVVAVFDIGSGMMRFAKHTY